MCRNAVLPQNCRFPFADKIQNWFLLIPLGSTKKAPFSAGFRTFPRSSGEFHFVFPFLYSFFKITSGAIPRTYSPSAHGPPLPDALQNSTPSLSETEKLFQNSPFTFLYYTRSFQYLQSFSGIMFYFCPTALKQNFIFPNRHKKSPLLINSRDFPVSNQNLMRA